jgi:hypothetical protein
VGNLITTFSSVSVLPLLFFLYVSHNTIQGYHLTACGPPTGFSVACENIFPFPKYLPTLSSSLKKEVNLVEKTLQKVLAKYSHNFSTDST